MNLYTVGDVLTNYIGIESTRFDIADDGATLIVSFIKPTYDEIDQFKQGVSFEMRFIRLQNVIMMLAKIGNLNWVDAPYTPHLSKDLTQLTTPESGQGLALQLVLVDGATGEIKHMRLIGMSEKFTMSLYKAVIEEADSPWERDAYEANISSIYQRFSTKQLVGMSKNYFKIH